MYALIRPFLPIVLFTAGPQDLPTSSFLLKVTATAYLLVGIVSHMLLSRDLGIAVAVSVGDICIVSLLVYGALTIGSKTERLVQTLTALFGTGAIIGAATLPLHLWVIAANEAGTIGLGQALATVTLGVWPLAVLAHIIRHALSTTMWMGVAFSLMYLLLGVSLASALLPMPAPT